VSHDVTLESFFWGGGAAIDDQCAACGYNCHLGGIVELLVCSDDSGRPEPLEVFGVICRARGPVVVRRAGESDGLTGDDHRQAPVSTAS
jgi:hypothetical protein